MSAAAPAMAPHDATATAATNDTIADAYARAWRLVHFAGGCLLEAARWAMCAADALADASGELSAASALAFADGDRSRHRAAEIEGRWVAVILRAAVIAAHAATYAAERVRT